jgi:hypothetical protein
MKRKSTATRFWVILVTINLLVMIYPINLILRANGPDDWLEAAFVAIGSAFLLAVADTISILVAFL